MHCGPGPFSMAGPDMVSTMLRGVGFERITFERYDCDICIGRDLDDAIEFAMALGPAGEIIRLAGRRRSEAQAAGGGGAQRSAGALRSAGRHLGALEHLVHHGDESCLTAETGPAARSAPMGGGAPPEFVTSVARSRAHAASMLRSARRKSPRRPG